MNRYANLDPCGGCDRPAARLIEIDTGNGRRLRCAKCVARSEARPIGEIIKPVMAGIAAKMER